VSGLALNNQNKLPFGKYLLQSDDAWWLSELDGNIGGIRPMSKGLNEMESLGQCRIVANTFPYCLVPQGLYEPLHTSAYLNQLTNIDQNDQVFAGPMPSDECVLIFSSNIKKSSEPIDIVHVTEYLLELSKKQSGHSITLWFGAREFDIVIRDQGQLLALNRYQFQSGADVSYFTLALANKFNFHQQACNIGFGGMITEQSDIVDHLRKFFANVFALQLPQLKSDSAIPAQIHSLQQLIAACA